MFREDLNTTEHFYYEVMNLNGEQNKDQSIGYLICAALETGLVSSKISKMVDLALKQIPDSKLLCNLETRDYIVRIAKQINLSENEIDNLKLNLIASFLHINTQKAEDIYTSYE